MGKYSKVVSETYSQFKQKEAHSMEKYLGRLAKSDGTVSEVVGYGWCNAPMLIVDATQSGGWSRSALGPFDDVFKDCKSYWYVSVDDLID